MTPPAPLLVAAAVPAELARLEGELDQARATRLAGLPLTLGRLGGRGLALLVTGVGPVEAAAALGAALPCLRPRGLVVVGSGGAFPGSGLAKGDLALAASETWAQLGREPETSGGPAEPLPFQPQRIETDAELLAAVSGAAAHLGLPLAAGPFVTTATVTTRPATAAQVRAALAALVENMEGYAAARAARIHGVPFVELRGVSNAVGEADRARWDLPRAQTRVQEAFRRLLEEDAWP